MKVGIIGGLGESHTMHMKTVLENLGAEVILIDTLNFPKKTKFTLLDGIPIYEECSIEDIYSFYNRTIFYTEPPYDLEEKRKSGELPSLDGWYSEYTSERERQSLLGSWVRTITLQNKKIVNSAECFYLHYLKPYQINLLQKARIPVPKTLVTNDPNKLLEFKNQFKNLIYKPVAGGASCNLLAEADLSPNRLSLLCNAPVIFQEFIQGTDIRIYVLNGKILCAIEIETDNVDFRGHEKAIRIIKLPQHIEDMCIKAAKCCSMIFTGIDVKRTKNDNYILLECNPSPMFIGFQDSIDYPIAKTLAHFLMS